MNKKHFYSAVILLLFLAIGIQTTHAIDIPTDTSIGIWDEVNRVYTLNTDVLGGLVITESNLTLDGGEYTVTVSGSGIGVFLSSITGVTIKNLNVTGSGSEYGIYLTTSDSNILSGNQIQHCWQGIRLSHGQDNKILGNEISYNYRGIVLSGYPYNNQVYNNNFLSNDKHAYVISPGITTDYGNLFNLDLPIGGNHWSGWITDTDGDGIVDNPYVLEYETGPVGGDPIQDNLPWVVPNGWSPEALILHLIDTVTSMNLQQGIDNSLDAKLDSALNALDDINQNNDVAAINSLNAFKSAVEAQRGNKLTDAQADELIAEADSIIAMLS